MKIGFVTPWYGPDIPGGMESETRRTAAQLQQAGYDVEILTTCIRDFQADWERNYHRPGLALVEGIPVRRFRVGKRDKAAFDRVNWRLMQGLPLSAAEEETYIEEMFRAPELFAYLEQQQQAYLFVFIPYMFATTYYGVQIAPDRSLVIPCLHDESYARLSLYRRALPQARALVLHTEAERRLAESLLGDSGQMRLVLGEGVDSGFEFDGDRFRRKYGIAGPFVLYVGRRDAGKNTPLLLRYWQRYAGQDERGASLVLIGSGDVAGIAAAGGKVVDLGYVAQQDKYDAYAAATVLCQPSLNESFSLVLMESWLTETPALVHGRCAVTREHCSRCNGGLYFTGYEEFAATVDYFFDQPAAAKQMGRNGRRYVLDNFQWPAIVAKYARLFAEMPGWSAEDQTKWPKRETETLTSNG